MRYVTGLRGFSWSSIAEVRNYLVHSHGRYDAATVWSSIESDAAGILNVCVSSTAQIESRTN